MPKTAHYQTAPTSGRLTFIMRIMSIRSATISLVRAAASVIPRSADNIDTTWYRVTLTVTDSSGLSTTQLGRRQAAPGHAEFDANDPEARLHDRRHTNKGASHRAGRCRCRTRTRCTVTAICERRAIRIRQLVGWTGTNPHHHHAGHRRQLYGDIRQVRHRLPHRGRKAISERRQSPATRRTDNGVVHRQWCRYRHLGTDRPVPLRAPTAYR